MKIQGIDWTSTGERVTGEPGNWQYLDGRDNKGNSYQAIGLINPHDFSILEVEEIEKVTEEELQARRQAEIKRLQKVNTWLTGIKQTLDNHYGRAI